MTAKEDTATNPWLAGLDELANADVVYQKAYRAAEPVRFAKQLSLEQRMQLVNDALEAVYVPTERGCQVMVSWIARITAFLRHRYPDKKTYLSTIYGGVPACQHPSFVCLTGPAGVGKSALIDALQRVLPSPRTVAIDPAHRKVPIQLLQRIKVGGNDTNNMILRSVANPAFIQQSLRLSQANAIAHLTQWFYSCGAGALVVDEMQFLTQSATANTRVAKLLMALGFPGVPVTYVANYSLGHRLKSRPHEERQRFLAESIVIEPERGASASWHTLVEEYVRACPQLLKFDPTRDADELFRLSAGLPRVLRQLVLAAMRQFGREKRAAITIDTLRYAYRSRGFDTQRTDVEALMSLGESSLLARRRKDLVCPFSGPSVDRVDTTIRDKAVGNARSGPLKSDQHVPLSAQSMLESTLTPEGQKTLKDLRRSKAVVTNKGKSGASVHSIRRKHGLTEADLYAGADAVRKLSHRSKRRLPKGGDGDD